MKRAIVVASLVAILGMACSNEKETPSGYKFKVVRAGDGKTGEAGNVLVLNMILKDQQDSVWSDSRTADFPTMVQKQDSVPGGDMVLEVLQMLTKGDSVTFRCSAKDLFEKTFRSEMPPGVKAEDYFTFEIGVVNLLTEEEARKLQNEVLAKLNEKEAAKEREQMAIDTEIIDRYLKENSIEAQKTESGLRYVITQKGKGDNAKAGQLVRVNYSGFLLDGRCFDSSIESVARQNNVYNELRAPYQPIELTIGYREVIPGWEEALTLMNKGSKMTVYIPSGLAYGPRKRSDIIVENSILKFDMELLDIK
jgi:FKBP-type peptidyl-prolyl cis-trans isomerase FkpA